MHIIDRDPRAAIGVGRAVQLREDLLIESQGLLDVSLSMKHAGKARSGSSPCVACPVGGGGFDCDRVAGLGE